jgi:hypothetical protein
MLLANLSDERRPNPAASWGQPIWGDAPARDLLPCTVYAALGEA